MQIKNASSKLSFEKLYQAAITLSNQSNGFTCSSLQRALKIKYSLAQKIIRRLAKDGHPIPGQANGIKNPKISIVFIDNSGTLSMQEITSTRIENMTYLTINSALVQNNKFDQTHVEFK